MSTLPIPFFGGSYQPETLAWLVRVSAAGGVVSSTSKAATDKFVIALKNAGVFSLFRRLNLFCGDSVSALVPLVNTNGGVTDTNNGATYTELTGWSTNGTSQYISTGYTPSEATGGLSAYLRTTQTSDTTARVVMGCRDAGATQIFRLIGNTSTAGVATSGAIAASWGGILTSGVGPAAGGFVAALWHSVRRGATDAEMFKNGVSVATSATSVTPGTPSQAMNVLANNGGGTVGGYLASGSAVGAYGVDTGMTAVQAAAYQVAMQAFQVALNRSV